MVRLILVSFNFTHENGSKLHDRFEFFTATVINRLQGGFAYFTELKAVKIFRSEG